MLGKSVSDLGKSFVEDGSGEGGGDDLRDHVESVVNGGEGPGTVEVDDVGGIVGVPLKVQFVPDGNTGDQVAEEAKGGHQQGAQGGGNQQVPGIVFGEAHLPEDAAQAQEGEGQDVVRKDTDQDAYGSRYPGHIA